jgi:hypothetical protein
VRARAAAHAHAFDLHATHRLSPQSESLSPKSKKRNAVRLNDAADLGAIVRALSRPMHLHQQRPNGLQGARQC